MPLGKYHVVDLVKTFVYMDAITVDTPILDDKIKKLITDVENIHHRLERGERFVQYLNDCAFGIKDAEFQQAWGEVSAAVTAEISSIKYDLES